MKILHLANWNSTNIGNGALIHGTERVLSEDAPMPLEFVAEPWDDYTFKRKFFDESFVELVNKHDALLVNGAVTFNAYRKSMLHTGMRFNLPLPLWKEIRKPIIFYGLSYRCWPFQTYPNAAALKKTILYALSQPNIFFGVRNDGTKEWLKNKIGVDSPKIIEVPDPGLFVPAENHEYPELRPDTKSIFIAFNGEDALHRYAPAWERMVWRYIEPIIGDRVLRKGFMLWRGYARKRKAVATQIARAVEKISHHTDAQFVLVPHYLDDYMMIDDFITAVQERIAHQRIVSTGLLAVSHTGYFYGRYKQADLAIAMRVHSMSPSIGLNVPVIPLTSQGRMRNFLSKIGLAHIAVDVSQEEFGAALAARAIEILKNPTPLKEELEMAVARLRAQTKEVNRQVFSLLAPSK